jgi:hypothetical protein
MSIMVEQVWDATSWNGATGRRLIGTVSWWL